ELEKQTDVSLRVFNLRGQMVRNLVNETQTSGSYTAVWNGRNDAGISVPSGVYFYAFKAGDYTQTRRMTLLK
ncbi:gliding motility-associated C-terminal domain-containing protein, partial [candidate division KSB1 bacterium]|nr:gliding motility-associated C-terminal domain-containing protein [candidate division KSB1 bacterium]